MSEITLNILDAERAIYGRCHGSTADRLVAALCSDPETIEELDKALVRFEAADHGGGLLQQWHRGTDEEPWDAGIMFIDLAARLVAYDSTYSHPSHRGSVEYHNGKHATDIHLWHHLADEWHITHRVDFWRGTSKSRRAERLARPRFDARPILFGKPLYRFLAVGCRDACRERSSPEDARDEDASYEAIKRIHARWLVTPREDLLGAAPRDVLLAEQHHIDMELQDRGGWWSAMGKCPTPLSPESAAYRYAGFGTHQVVLYYELIRALLGSCLDRCKADREINLSDEMMRLEKLADEWLHAPGEDLCGRTPAEIMDKERRRIPMAMSGEDAVVDDDCPMCQMLGEMTGPMFWHLDGCNMDDDFEFSFYKSREEWEEEQRSWEEFNRKFDEEQRLEREAEQAGSSQTSNWSRSFSAGVNEGDAAAGHAGPVGLFGIGAHLAELIVDLKAGEDDRRTNQAHVDALNHQFGNLRIALDEGQGELIEPIVDCFCDELAFLGAAEPDLLAKCEDLEEKIRDWDARLFRRPSIDDIPF
jgi:hypothetical protein